MQLFLRDPTYTDRLAAFLTSVGRRAVVGAPDRVDLDEAPEDSQNLELELYLRVWHVLYPDAEVELALG
jgi:hypothetical protein